MTPTADSAAGYAVPSDQAQTNGTATGNGSLWQISSQTPVRTAFVTPQPGEVAFPTPEQIRAEIQAMDIFPPVELGNDPNIINALGDAGMAFAAPAAGNAFEVAISPSFLDAWCAREVVGEQPFRNGLEDGPWTNEPEQIPASGGQQVLTEALAAAHEVDPVGPGGLPEPEPVGPPVEPPADPDPDPDPAPDEPPVDGTS